MAKKTSMTDERIRSKGLILDYCTIMTHDALSLPDPESQYVLDCIKCIETAVLGLGLLPVPKYVQGQLFDNSTNSLD